MQWSIILAEESQDTCTCNSCSIRTQIYSIHRQRWSGIAFAVGIPPERIGLEAQSEMKRCYTYRDHQGCKQCVHQSVRPRLRPLDGRTDRSLCLIELTNLRLYHIRHQYLTSETGQYQARSVRTRRLLDPWIG